MWGETIQLPGLVRKTYKENGVWDKLPRTRGGGRFFPGGSAVKILPANEGEAGSIPRSVRSLREGHDNSLQYSCLENPMDRGAWWSLVLRFTKSLTWRKCLSLQARKWVQRPLQLQGTPHHTGCSSQVSLPTPHCTIKALWRNGYSRAKVGNVRDESGMPYCPGDEGNC